MIPNRVKFDLKEAYRGIEYYKSNIFRRDEIFSQVEVETNTNCNRKCKICPVSITTKPKEYMSVETFDNLVSQLGDIGFGGIFSPVFYNEPTLDQRLPDLMRRAKHGIPDSEVIVYTNGSLITEEYARTLVENGVDGIIVSQYQDNLAKDDKSDVISQFPRDLKRHIRYRVLTDDQMLSTRAKLVEVQHPVTKQFCFQASTSVVIEHEGNVVLCCNDYDTHYRFGNINDRHIMEIWNDSEYKALRKELRRGNFELDICHACTGN